MKRAVSALLVLLLLLAPVPGIAAAAGDDPSEVPEETVVAQAESDEGQGPEETQDSQPQDAQAEGEAEPPAQPSEPDGDGRDEGPGAADGSRENKDASPYLQAVITASRDTYAPRDTASFSIRYALEPGVASPGDYVVALIPETVAHRASLSCSFQHFAEMKSLGQGRFLLILGEQAAAGISGTMTLYVEIDAQEAVADTITVGKAAITIAVAPAMEDSVGTDGHSGTEAAAAQEATESGTGVDGGADENGSPSGDAPAADDGGAAAAAAGAEGEPGDDDPSGSEGLAPKAANSEAASVDDDPEPLPAKGTEPPSSDAKSEGADASEHFHAVVTTNKDSYTSGETAVVSVRYTIDHGTVSPAIISL